MPRSQFSDPTLTREEALSACGPAAALAFTEANGRNPTLREALDLAKAVGWSAAGGMNGFQNQIRLMNVLKQKGLVGDFEAAATPDWTRVTAEAQSGRPVTISTPRHYFTVSGYDPDRGYFVGTSGTDLRGGKEWMTAQEIAGHGRGAPNGVIYMSGQPTRARQQFVEANVDLPTQTEAAKTPTPQTTDEAPGSVGESAPPVQQKPDPDDPLKKWLAGQEMLNTFSRRLIGQIEAPALPTYTLPGLPKIDLGWGSPYRLGTG